MLWWDARIKEARLKSRLESLGLLKAVVYAAGCVTHAKNRIVTTSTGNVSILFGSVLTLLDTFWNHFPEVLGKPAIHSMAREASDLRPGEDDGGPFEAYEDYLIWGVIYAFSLATRTTYSTEAADEALGLLIERIGLYSRSTLSGISSTEPRRKSGKLKRPAKSALQRLIFR